MHQACFILALAPAVALSGGAEKDLAHLRQDLFDLRNQLVPDEEKEEEEDTYFDTGQLVAEDGGIKVTTGIYTGYVGPFICVVLEGGAEIKHMNARGPGFVSEPNKGWACDTSKGGKCVVSNKFARCSHSDHPKWYDRLFGLQEDTQQWLVSSADPTTWAQDKADGFPVPQAKQIYPKLSKDERAFDYPGFVSCQPWAKSEDSGFKGGVPDGYATSSVCLGGAKMYDAYGYPQKRGAYGSDLDWSAECMSNPDCPFKKQS